MFLEDAMVDFMFSFHREWADARWNPCATGRRAAVAAWFGLFLPDEPPPADVSDPRGARRLGLCSSATSCSNGPAPSPSSGGVTSYDMLTEAFARNMPNASRARSGSLTRCWC